MKIMINQKNDSQAIAIGTNEEDAQFLKFLWDNRQLVGFYRFAIIGEKNKNTEDIKFILQNIPEATAVAYINNGVQSLRPPLKNKEIFDDGR